MTSTTDTNVRVSPAPKVPALLAATDLVETDTRSFFRTVGEVNSAYAAALSAFEAAQDNLIVVLTEQVVRHVLDRHAEAAMVFVRVAAEYHHAEDGTQCVSCEGHNHRLVPFEVLDSEGIVLGGFEPLSPVMFLMERLSPMLGLEDQVLDIETREWALDCTTL